MNFEDGEKAGAKVLLVVDDDPLMCEAVVRILTGWFDGSYSATNIAAAEEILSLGQVTHLLCDQYLDRDGVLGTDIIPRWRRWSRTIERVVLYSGADLSEKKIPEEIDAVLRKGGTNIDMLHSLGILVEGGGNGGAA